MNDADFLAHGAKLTIDLGALADNWRIMRARAGGAECGAVVKANAYGIGIEKAVPALAAAGCRTFFVAHLSEGIRVRAELVRSIQSSASRLNRLVANLLDMSRLDAGRLKLKLDWCDVGEVIGVAAQRVEECLLHRPITIDVPPDLPLVRMDYVLVEQALLNLLHNAAAYTPPGTRVRLTASRDGDHLAFTARQGLATGPRTLGEAGEEIEDFLLRGAARAHGELEVLDHGQVREQPPSFRHERDAAPVDFIGAQRGDLGAIEFDAPAARRQHAGDRAHGRGLSDAVATDDASNMCAVTIRIIRRVLEIAKAHLF